MHSKLIGKRVDIIDSESMYYQHYGFIVAYDGHVYHISGGSISTSINSDVTPIFSRDQFKIRRNINSK